MKIPEKFKSRKVFILVIWLFFSCVALFNKSIETETKNIILSFSGTVSLAYYGVNAYQKKLYNDADNGTMPDKPNLPTV
jgi:hypothetical protein